MKNKIIKIKSIRIRLFLTLSIVIATIILLLVFTNSILLEAFYTYSKVFAVKQAFCDINDLYNLNSIISFDDIEKVEVKNNFDILIETENDIIIYATDQNIINTINRNKDLTHITNSTRNAERTLLVNDNMVINSISINDMRSILLSGKLDNGYSVYIQIKIAAIQESVRISNNLLIIMGIIITVLSAVVASIIAKNFTRPIYQLNSIANKMSNLDFSEKYRISDSDDEINELGKSINIMSDKLELTIKQLRSNNNQLEKDIEKKSKIDEMRKQFISDVSHELKTPIALIQGYAEGLVENVNSDEESKKYYAEVILDESNKMDRLVRQLLELMKIEYGKRKFNNSKFDVCELIKEVLRKCNVMIEEKGASVEFESKYPVNIYADEFYIDQVFTNYVTNAIKHVEEVGGNKKIVIDVITDENNNRARISVFNTGDRLSEESLEKIWGRFYKVDSSRNRDDGGTGIGLSLVKAIMTNYNSEYGVINKENGVEFYFYIDLAKNKEAL